MPTPPPENDPPPEPSTQTGTALPFDRGQPEGAAGADSMAGQGPSTLLTPPFVEEVAGLNPPKPLQPGDRVDDFEILGLLGEGSFAKVFLARQISLNRQVALKATAYRGSEACTLANLEHDHIVRVFSESADARRGLRLLCMQYVPGTTLERIIRKLRGWQDEARFGKAFLEALDTPGVPPPAFDPAAARDRERLGGYGLVECVCWLGGRLAEALAHAHGQGVLHRDVKPANILVNLYGRPLLADFNLAVPPERLRGPDAESFGGTLRYMAPEHLDAFHQDGEAPAGRVDERSDVYSLGVVLYELVTGRLPFAPVPRDVDFPEALRAMAAERRAGAPPLVLKSEGAGRLARVIARCLDPRPGRRYQTAAELAQALEGCRDLGRMDKELPGAGRLVRAAERHPFWWLAALTLLPHFLGSVVNIGYNGLRIDLTAEQHAAFARITLGYNVLIYPLCVWLIYRLLAPLVRGWRQLDGPEPPDDRRLAELRRRALAFPLGIGAVALLGWFPGAVLFPLGIDFFAGPVGGEVYGHFLISFAIAGLIALTYSVFGVHFVVLRILYPRLWADARELRREAERELAPLGRRLWILQVLAGLIPLATAALLVGKGADPSRGSNSGDFRLLILGLIGLGMACLVLTISVSGFLNRTLTVLTGGRRQDSSPRPL